MAPPPHRIALGAPRPRGEDPNDDEDEDEDDEQEAQLDELAEQVQILRGELRELHEIVERLARQER